MALTTGNRKNVSILNCENTEQGGLAATFDLAAFGLYMIAPVKKSVNHSKTLTSMREVQRSYSRICVFVLGDSIVEKEFVFFIVYLLLVFLATVQRLGTTFL